MAFVVFAIFMGVVLWLDDRLGLTKQRKRGQYGEDW